MALSTITLIYLAFLYVDIERTWWWLFQKRVMLTTYDIYVLVNKVTSMLSLQTSL